MNAPLENFLGKDSKNIAVMLNNLLPNKESRM
jgi:hypothetical protein